MANQETVKPFERSHANGTASAWASGTGTNLGTDRSTPANSIDSSSAGVVTNVTGFGEDLLTLAELQTRLIGIEIRQNLEAVRSSGALIVIGSIVAVSALPVILVGIAELLISELGMKRGYALLSVGAVAIVIAGSCMAIARSWLRTKRLGLPLASEEFARNVNWLRTILRQSGRWPLRR
jgi:Putative Actinobacterial Holin-X, holin superfamily III